ncbi:hypothetical protein IMZ48_24010 [Candidatus Bathyarchaeota archaeon]|nr:hypothetical protein [Candidatus Bathyarchaeota archaeon]
MEVADAARGAKLEGAAGTKAVKAKVVVAGAARDKVEDGVVTKAATVDVVVVGADIEATAGAVRPEDAAVADAAPSVPLAVLAERSKRRTSYPLGKLSLPKPCFRVLLT